MEYRELSNHLWRAIEAQAKAVADSIEDRRCRIYTDETIEKVNELELLRLHPLIEKLKEKSPH